MDGLEFNLNAVQKYRVKIAIASGALAGIARLESAAGLALYLAVQVIASVPLALKNWRSAFPTFRQATTAGIANALGAYVLAWVLVFSFAA